MDVLLARAAQSAYNKAGFSKEDAYRCGEKVARYLHDHLDAARQVYRTDDEFELAYRLALATISHQPEMAEA